MCESDNICGEIPDSPVQFTSRLSDQCAALFDSYQSSWSKLGMSNLVSHDPLRPCDKKAAHSANNPVLVSSNTTATFALCTVPKSGCSNIRKLLFALVTDPIPPEMDAMTQFSKPHHFKYPTVWFYDVPSNDSQTPASTAAMSRRLANAPDGHIHWQPQTLQQQPASSSTAAAAAVPQHRTQLEEVAALSIASSIDDDTTAVPETAATSTAQSAPDPAAAIPASTALPTTPSVAPRRLPPHVPTFAIGRNPYLRLLSGFRDKMVANPSRRDTWTSNAVNTHFGLPPETTWEDTPEAFRRFVHALWERGVSSVDTHFQPAVNVCGGAHNFRYDYYLRLEDLQNWFPCFMHGLGLRGWTEGGWGDSPYGRMFIGRDADRAFVTLKSYRSTPEETPQWDPVAGTATSGVRGVDWDLASGDQCWWNPPGKSCAQYYDSFTAVDGSVLPGGLDSGVLGELRGATRRVHGVEMAEDVADGVGLTDVHTTESRKHWRRYYDQQAADLVFLLYAADFKEFGYERTVLLADGSP